MKNESKTTRLDGTAPVGVQTARELSLAFLDMVGHERDIYQLATLYPQRRRPPDHYLENLRCSKCRGSDLQADLSRVTCTGCGLDYVLVDGILDLRPPLDATSEWSRLNRQFLNYHRALTPHELIASAPIINYVSHRTGLRDARDIRVLDVGGGTGHTLCSFFRYSETLDYYLVDPNPRLLHDQFVRVYPELLRLPMSHFLGVAEDLPFAPNAFDLVLSLSAIDHYRDYRRFMKEAHRLAKPGGRILVSGHLDRHASGRLSVARLRKLRSLSAFESIGRRLFYARHRVGGDDHTLHLESVEPIAGSAHAVGFLVEEQDVFKGFFYMLGRKPSKPVEP